MQCSVTWDWRKNDDRRVRGEEGGRSENGERQVCTTVYGACERRMTGMLISDDGKKGMHAG